MWTRMGAALSGSDFFPTTVWLDTLSLLMWQNADIAVCGNH